MGPRDLTWLMAAARKEGLGLNRTAEIPQGKLENSQSPPTKHSAAIVELLKQQHLLHKATKPLSDTTNLLRKISKVNPTFSYEDYAAAIQSALDSPSTPAFLESLIQEFCQKDLKCTRTKLLGHRDAPTRESKCSFIGSLLTPIVETKEEQLDKIRVLSGYADSNSLNNLLRTSVDKGNLAVAEILLRRAGDPNTCQDAILSAISKGQEDLVRLILRGPVRAGDELLGSGLVRAVNVGPEGIVEMLLANDADCNYQNASPLETAIMTSNKRQALLMLAAPRYPSPQNLDRLVGRVYNADSGTDGLQQSHLLLEFLLRGGAAGDCTDKALVTAVSENDMHAYKILIQTGASVKYNSAEAFTKAVEHLNIDAIRVLSTAELGSGLATQVLETLPESMYDLAGPETRLELLQILLKQGATGNPVNEALITAVRKHNLEALELLLRHRPSVNYRCAEALRHALSSAQRTAAMLMLDHEVEQQNLRRAFPLICGFGPEDRRLLTRKFLDVQLSGQVVDDALHETVSDPTPARDRTMMEILVRGGADVNQNGGELFRLTILEKDFRGLEVLSKGRYNSETLGTGVRTAVSLQDRECRTKFVTVLLKQGANGPPVLEALAESIKDKDQDLFNLILKFGQPNLNHGRVRVVESAIYNSDIYYFECIMQDGMLNVETRNAALLTILRLPRSGMDRPTKIDQVLARIEDATTLSQAVCLELESLRNAGLDSLEILAALLRQGADVNWEEAKALRMSVDMRAYNCTDCLLRSKPQQRYLDAAFATSDDIRAREQLLRTGVSESVRGEMLVKAVGAEPCDMPALQQLLEFNTSVNHERGRPIDLAVRNANLDLLSVLLQRGPSARTLDGALGAAMGLQDAAKQPKVLRQILEAGASGQSVNEALIAAAGRGAFGVALCDLLLEFGASADYDNGAAVLRVIQREPFTESILRSIMDQKPSRRTISIALKASVILSDQATRYLIMSICLSSTDKGVPNMDDLLYNMVSSTLFTPSSIH